MAAFAFSKNVRLNSSAEFGHVFQQADRYAASGLTLLARTNGLTSARLGLAIAKKNTKAASARNRLRRLARETFRLRRTELPAVDVIMLTKPGFDRLSNPEIVQALGQCFDKLCRRTAAAASVTPVSSTPAPAYAAPTFPESSLTQGPSHA